MEDAQGLIGQVAGFVKSVKVFFGQHRLSINYTVSR